MKSLIIFCRPFGLQQLSGWPYGLAKKYLLARDHPYFNCGLRAAAEEILAVQLQIETL